MKNIYIIIVLVFGFQVKAQSKSDESERKSMLDSERSNFSKMLSFNINPNTLNYDLKSQKLELQVDPAVQKVSGTVTSQFIPNQNLSSIYFDLANTLTVSEVKFHGNNLTFSQLPHKRIKN
ncbi:hypothetical protein [Halpernia sp. GG3]